MAICNKCNGDGTLSEGIESCSSCSGAGVNIVTGERCFACSGIGHIGIQKKLTCGKCRGSGHLPDPRSTSKSKPKPEKSKEDFSLGMGFIAFVVAAIAIYKPEDENGAAAVLLGILAGAIVGTYYKAIVIIAIVVAVLWVMGQNQ